LTDIDKQYTNYTQLGKKQTTTKTAKQNYPGSVAFYDTRPANEMGLFYNDKKLKITRKPNYH